MEYLNTIGQKAQNAKKTLGLLGQQEKNKALKAVSAALVANADKILSQNAEDVKIAKENNIDINMIKSML